MSETSAAVVSNPAVFERVRIVKAAIEMFRTHAFHEASLDLVAATAGVPVDVVAAQFPTWDGLILATIDRWNVQRMQPIMPMLDAYGTVRFLRGIVAANVDDPALMRLLTSMLNIAATPEHPMSPLLQQRWFQFQRLIQTGLTRDVDLGREPTTMEPARGAEQLVAIYEGLQLQSMVRPQMDLLDSFDRAISRMREGWQRAYIPPVWELDLQA